MRLIFCALCLLLGLSFVGCGGDTGPQTMDTSAIEQYVEENPEAVARQAELDAMAEAEALAEEAEEE